MRFMLDKDIDQVIMIEKSLKGRQWSRKAFLDSLESENARLYVSGDSGRISGYCICYHSLEESEIVNIAVDEALRRNGTGSALLTHVISSEREAGCEKMFLEVRVSNEAAIKMYEKAGFAICGTRKDFYEEPAEDGYIMALSLAN